MARAFATAASTFERTLEELRVPARELGDPVELGRRAALLATADALWEKHLGPMFDRERVQTLLNVRSRQAVSALTKRGKLLALPAPDGRLRFPAFQFSSQGRPYEAIPTILKAFAPTKLDPYTIASWFVTPKKLLQGTSPAAWLKRGRDPERAIEAARRTAARFAH